MKAEGERGGGEGASERRKMGATRYVLGSAILGLFWSSLLKGVLTNSSTSRCDYPPCSCDHYGRLTCDCKDEGEVGSPQARYPRQAFALESIFDWISLSRYREEVEGRARKKSLNAIANIDLGTYLPAPRDKKVYPLLSRLLIVFNPTPFLCSTRTKRCNPILDSCNDLAHTFSTLLLY